jgi:hypothetical protein
MSVSPSTLLDVLEHREHREPRGVARAEASVT